jgi:hypothetical protein
MSATTRKAEFPLFSDYQRIFYLLKRADDLSIQISDFDYSKAREYFSIIKAVYRNIKPILNEEDEKVIKVESSFVELEKQTIAIVTAIDEGNLEGKKFNETLKNLMALHDSVLDLKQQCGLGILTGIHLEGKAKFEQALGM